ncbi:MAG: double-strand break repair helicase AddA [Limibacillus sp.]
MSATEPLNEDYRRTVENQRLAADPRYSAWVGASAGSGKTRVLSDRVLRLLLAEGDPTRILCLTFTKAAAAEMERRIAERLAEWTALSDAALDKQLKELLGEDDPSEERRSAARSLFAKMLDAPGGLKIQTIHSFCQSVLARFPLEAGVTPNFETLDENSALEKLREAREDVLANVASQRALAEALPDLVSYIGDADFAKLVNQLIAAHGRLRSGVERLGTLDFAEEALYQRLDLPPKVRPESIAARAREMGEAREGDLLMAAGVLAESNDTDKANAALIRAGLAKAAWALDDFLTYSNGFLTAKGERQKRSPSAQIKRDRPEIEEILGAEAERLIAERQRYFAALEARLSIGLLRMAYHTLDAYERLKAAAAALDFDDQIAKAQKLLSSPGLPSWVLYKLDGGLDHLLVDEAQDTSPEQWDIIGALVTEFFEGESAAEERRSPELPKRSLFTVGDPKQSIYGFQGARPDLFAKKREQYKKLADAAGVDLIRVPLNMSFRSTRAVLQAVDAVFAPPEKHKGVVFDEDWQEHAAFRKGDAGSVDLWQTIDPEEEKEQHNLWEPARQQFEAEKPRRTLAAVLAERIWRMTSDPAGAQDPESQLRSQERRLRPGDIMVLVRRRNAFVTELVRELKALEVPVTGVDRMKLMDQLAIMDLVALGQVLLLPEDDLTLAAVLKSPLIGLEEDELFELAYDRKGASLWERLRRKSASKPSFAAAWRFLEAEHNREGFESAYQFYGRILGAEGGRQRMLARLGPEAEDPLDEFLSLAQEHARLHPPSLQGFLHWLAQDDRQVKRDLEQGANAVRIMTAHAAKGLQAPMVILPDTLGAKRTAREMLWTEDPEEGGQGGPALPLFPLAKGERSALAGETARAMEEREAEERRRLLYVAMTRAEDRLIVCGWRGERDDLEEAWYSHVQQGFERLAESGATIEEIEVEAPRQGVTLSARRLSCPQSEPVKKKEKAAAGAALDPLPDWARSGEAPVEPTPTKPLQPSRPSAPEPASLSPLGEEQAWRFKRGNLVHRLLQTLPDLPEADWAAAAARFLGQRVHGLSAAQAADLTTETLGVLRAPELAGLFGPGSRAEAPVGGVIGTRSVSGQVDRLLVTPEEIKIIDYKTNRPAPETEAEVPEVYLSQMASYRALLRAIYPDRPVTCYLLWTEAPRLMQISERTLDAHSP